jgi:threonine/homoserine/homoserine lactone efflux protein
MIYLMLVIVATTSPGPAVIFIMSNATLYGWKKTLYIAFGNIIGLLCLGLISVTGLGAVIQASEYIFNIIKYIGAIYLIYLGIKLILQKRFNFNNIQNNIIEKDISSKKVFIQAFIVAISNPKAIVFLAALFPQFINLNKALPIQFAILIGTLMFFSFSFLMIYALLAHKAKNWLNRSNRMSVMNKVSGGIFIGFGALLATSSNK